MNIGQAVSQSAGTNQGLSKYRAGVPSLSIVMLHSLARMWLCDNVNPAESRFNFPSYFSR
jgi:hypothetical protein